jgi:hypothetical protein
MCCRRQTHIRAHAELAAQPVKLRFLDLLLGMQLPHEPREATVDLVLIVSVVLEKEADPALCEYTKPAVATGGQDQVRTAGPSAEGACDGTVVPGDDVGLARRAALARANRRCTSSPTTRCEKFRSRSCCACRPRSAACC